MKTSAILSAAVLSAGLLVSAPGYVVAKDKPLTVVDPIGKDPHGLGREEGRCLPDWDHVPTGGYSEPRRQMCGEHAVRHPGPRRGDTERARHLGDA